MNDHVPGDGLPLFDRCCLGLINGLIGRLSPPAVIRWRWHLLREKAR